MKLKNIIPAARSTFELWFHKRNIIIVSKRKVKHIPLSGGLQFSMLLFAATGVCWLSYSTGSFMAARAALKEQSQTLRAMASNRVETGFNTVLPTDVKPTLPAVNLSEEDKSASEPMFTVAAADNSKMAEHMRFLEKRVSELQATNESIVARVRDKTAGHIDDLEAIIKQTGLKTADLKHDFSQTAASTDKHKHTGGGEGGPFIPDDSAKLTPDETQLFSQLDELALLRQIVGTLPLASPLKESDEESGFGHRTDPFTGRMAFHSGLDLAGPVGAQVFSTADGKVTDAGRRGAYGNCIDINHGYGISTRYGHLSQILVMPGQTIHKGDLIGIQGSTGRSTGPHVHYEVRYHDQPLNPKNFLEAGQDVSEE